MPVIGFLGSTSADPVDPLIAAFRQGLSEAGYVDGRNVAIEYRWAEGQYDRLPAMVSELLRRQVAVIAALRTPSALAAKTATTMIPIVFSVTEDPVKLGLVASVARPGGNATGVSYLLSELAPKQLGLLRELFPAASRFGLLVNPKNENAETITKDLKAAAGKIGVEIDVVRGYRQPRDRGGVRGADPGQSAARWSSAPTRSFTTGGFSLPRWRRVTLYPQSITFARTPKPAA